jgi:hypothetical protein
VKVASGPPGPIPQTQAVSEVMLCPATVATTRFGAHPTSASRSTPSACAGPAASRRDAGKRFGGYWRPEEGEDSLDFALRVYAGLFGETMPRADFIYAIRTEPGGET